MLLRSHTQYVADGRSRIQEVVNRATAGSEAIVVATDVIVTSGNAETMTASQWATVGAIRDLVPDATAVLRIHHVCWKKDRTITVGPFFGVLVTQRVGPFTLRREFAVDDQSTK